MGPEALQRARAGETLPSTRMRTPLVELPLGATEDRICGTIDIEKALTEGIKVHFVAVPCPAEAAGTLCLCMGLALDGTAGAALHSVCPPPSHCVWLWKGYCG